MERDSHRLVPSGQIPSKNTTIVRTAMLVCSILIFTSLAILASTPTASDYEISIYKSVPWTFWITVIAAIAVSQSVIIYSIGRRHRKWATYAYIAIIATNLIVVSVPLVRHYEFYGRGDVLSHVGYMKDLVTTGHVGTSNQYPSTHILAVFLSLCGDFGLGTVTVTVPQVFTGIFSIWLVVFMRRFLRNESQLFTGLALSCLLVFNSANAQVISYVTLAPNALSFFFFAFAVYAILRSTEPSTGRTFAVVAAIVVVCIPPFHPLTSLILAVVMIIAWSLFSKTSHPRYSRIYPQRTSISRFIALLSVSYLVWHSYAHLLVGSLEDVVNSLLVGVQDSEFQRYSSLVGTAHLSITNLLIAALQTYGTFIIMGVAASISVVRVLYIQTHRLRDTSDPMRLARALFIVLTITGAFMAFVTYIVPFGRIFSFALLFGYAVVASEVGTRLAHSSSDDKPRIPPSRRIRIFPIIFTIVLIVLVCMSVFSVFLSPIVRYGNQQVTSSEYNGMSFFFETRNVNRTIVELGISQERFYDAIEGSDAPRLNIFYGEMTTPVDHFGYDSHDSISESYNSEVYMLITDLGEQFYPSVYGEFEDLWRFAPSDFEKLESDLNVQHVIATGTLDVYLIN